ncbi:MAG: hypothetical protein R2851_28550 [Caldilineaceae bacterium]
MNISSSTTVPRKTSALPRQAALAAAKATLRQAQSAYNEVAWQSNVGMRPRVAPGGSDHRWRPPRPATTRR